MMGKKSITFCKKLCSKNVNIILSDVEKKGLIYTESMLFPESKERVLSTCFQSLYPLVEFFDDFSEIPSDFFLQNSYLFAFAFFLDQSFDSLENYPSTRVRSSQISSYLLLNYFEWVMKAYNSNAVISIFYKYFNEQTNYLILEKKWNFPDLYISAYGSDKKLYKKTFLLFFPFELIHRMALFTHKNFTLLKKIFVNYFSFILLADDLTDLEEDIKQKCLTYPIILYYKSTGKLPKSREDITTATSQSTRYLNNFQENIKNLENDMGKHSLIINNTLARIKNELNNGCIKI